MDELRFEQIEEALKNNQLNFYNFYSADLDLTSYYSAEYYHNNPKDSINVEQLIKKVFTDIEVYTYHKGLDFNNLGEDLISAITFYDNQQQIFYAYIYLIDGVIEKFGNVEGKNKQYKTFLIDNKYITDKDNIVVKSFTNEVEMICEYWNKIKEIDPTILSSFNGDSFDYPYLYERLVKLKNKNIAAKTMSIFNYVHYRHGIVSIPEFRIADLLYLFRPRSEGGFLI